MVNFCRPLSLTSAAHRFNSELVLACSLPPRSIKEFRRLCAFLVLFRRLVLLTIQAIVDHSRASEVLAVVSYLARHLLPAQPLKASSSSAESAALSSCSAMCAL